MHARHPVPFSLVLALAIAACDTGGGGDGGMDGGKGREGGTPGTGMELVADRPPTAKPIIAPQDKLKDGSIEAGLRDDAGDDDGGHNRDAGDPCGNGKLDEGEACDPGRDGCCDIKCRGPHSAGVECRAPAGTCDLAEECDGVSFVCPADDVRAFGQVCRSAAGACDAVEICNGVDKACPADEVAPSSVKCASAGGQPCDADDYCDGSTKACPDLVEPSSTTCGGTPTTCDTQDHCDGSGKSCPASYASDGLPCGSATDTACDNPDTCDGAGNCAPNFEPNTANCGDSGTVCVNQDKCDGTGGCSDNGYQPDTTVCRADAGECDVPEYCDGSGTCPADGFENLGHACGSGASSVCDDPDTCDDGGTCLPNHKSNATECRAAAPECDTAEFCNDGVCPANTGPTDTTCIDTTPTDCYEARCDGAGACDQTRATQAGGTPCGSALDDRCTNPDTCGADKSAGQCLANHELNGTACDANLTLIGDECYTPFECTDGVCLGGDPKPEYSPCGNTTATDPDCDAADDCDGFGTCRLNHTAADKPCTDTDSGDCGVAECDGLGYCDPFGAAEPPETPCTDTTPDDCYVAQCDQGCNQTAEMRPSGTACGNLSDCLEEQCDPAGSCYYTENPEPDGHPCVVAQNAGPAECSSGQCCPGATVSSGNGCGLPDGQKIAFLTSDPIPPQLLGGRAGARAFCTQHAQNANLGGTFSPWLGDSFFDVFVDIGAGPFSRVDGAPLAANKLDLLDGTIQVPIEITQLNLTSVLPPPVPTGLYPDGTATGQDCNRWGGLMLVPPGPEAPGPPGPVGASAGLWSATDAQWTWASGTVDCTVPAPIYCFEDDCPNEPVVDFKNNPLHCGSCDGLCDGTCVDGTCQGIVFVSSTTHDGNFGGLAGADALCDSLAASARLPGRYIAWLGTSTAKATSRIIDQPYVRPDGKPVASNLTDLLNATAGTPLVNPINVDETGATSPAVQAWTGTWSDGTSYEVNCNDWTANGDDSGAYGNPQAVDGKWSYDGGSQSCDMKLPIYCFQTGPATVRTTQLAYTGGMQTFTVPPGVTKVHIQAHGAQGAAGGLNADGGGTGGSGGLGALTEGDLAVTGGQVLSVFVGGSGSGSTGGYNGGAAGGAPGASGRGGGGGGASDVRVGGATLGDRVITAGGGGGGGGVGCENTSVVGGNGGSGGGGNGGNGTNAPTSGGVAGGGFGGVGSTAGAKGTGCAGFEGAAGENGASGVGGTGGAGQICCCFSTHSDPSGGGGGGGYVGGGGGGGGSAGTTSCTGNDKGAGGGGAGGSSDTSGVTSGNMTPGVRSGSGLVLISY